LTTAASPSRSTGPCSAPTGIGVNAIQMARRFKARATSPRRLVTIAGGTGSGATAYAVMTDDGTGKALSKVGGIMVTSRGVYTVAPTAVVLRAAARRLPRAVSPSSTAANTSGGMTFAGSGTTALGGAKHIRRTNHHRRGHREAGRPVAALVIRQHQRQYRSVNGGSGGPAFQRHIDRRERRHHDCRSGRQGAPGWPVGAVNTATFSSTVPW